MPLALSTPVKFVKRVGDRIADQLARRNIETVEDLLYHLPFRYEDRLSPRPIAEMQPGEMASLLGDVRGSALLTTKTGTLFELTLGLAAPGIDITGGLPRLGQSTIKCLWFNGSYLREKFKLGPAGRRLRQARTLSASRRQRPLQTHAAAIRNPA